jgi:hypothetical protein
MVKLRFSRIVAFILFLNCFNTETQATFAIASEIIMNNLKSKNMKKVTILLASVLVVFLVGCSGSETYRGAWKAMDSYGAKYEILFDAKSFTVKDSAGKTEKYDYTQNSVKIENSVKTYGIQLGDGRGYQINFPNAKDENVGLIKDENGNPIFTISRNAYTSYEDVYKLK